MANSNKNPKPDVVEESDAEERETLVRSGNAERRVEESMETEQDENEVQWEKGSLLDYIGQEEKGENSRRSSPIPGPEYSEDERMDDFADFGGFRYGKRRYSEHFDFDYMPLSDPEDEVTAPPKLNTARRGKVRPTMHTWGLAEAQKQYEELMAQNKAEHEKELKECGRVLRSSTKGKGKGKGQTKECGKKKPDKDFTRFLTEANEFAEQVLEDAKKNPVQVPKEVIEKVDEELRRRKELEEEVDRELEADTVETEPVAGPSRALNTTCESISMTAESVMMDLGDLDDRPIDELKAIAGKKLMTVMTVATKSGNLQGRYVRDLKDAAKSLREVVECLAVRPDGEELRRLKTANHNLRKELEEIRKEMRELRQELRDRRSPPPPSAPPAPPAPEVPQATTPALPPALRDFDPEEFLERIQRMVAVTCGNIVTARIDALGLPPPPTIRPPLAADARRTAASGVSEAATLAVNDQESWATVTRRGKKGKGKKTVTPNVVAVVPVPAAVTGSSNAANLESVAPVPPVQPAAQTVPKPAARPRPKPRFVAPRSSAIVITLEPEAVSRGVTYKDALTEARKSIALEELTVDRVNLRQTATGARILELFGEDSGAKADTLATKMREKLVGVAKITRPIKCTDVRIVGLDDSIEKEEIISVLIEKSGFGADQIKVGEVRNGPRGGSVIASVPTIGAKKLMDAGRLLIGWSTAQVQALDPRPLRCFKCMGVGHTRQLCPSPFDRSDVCFRCGVFGHKAAGCFAEARCAVCEDADRPFQHTMGGRDCNPPPVKGKVVTPAVSSGPAVQQEPGHEAEGDAMSVHFSDRDSLDEA